MAPNSEDEDGGKIDGRRQLFAHRQGRGLDPAQRADDGMRTAESVRNRRN
jgi:hypothetical protein